MEKTYKLFNIVLTINKKVYYRNLFFFCVSFKYLIFLYDKIIIQIYNPLWDKNKYKDHAEYILMQRTDKNWTAYKSKNHY